MITEPAENSALNDTLKTITEKCINCTLCQKECEFLTRYGKPKEIAEAYILNKTLNPTMPFECSLCRLCAAVCPVEINPAKLFLDMRREAEKQGNGCYKAHSRILAYETRGNSKRYTWYSLPEDCDTILFPGCTFPGIRPELTLRLFNHMAQEIPTLGIVLDCCNKISHDLGRKRHFFDMFEEMKAFLLNNGIRKVFVSCPNCYNIFDTYGGALEVITVYEYISKNGLPEDKSIRGSVTIHDPCAFRFNGPVQSAVRDLLQKQQITIREMPHSGEKTLCCGEGGSVGFVSPKISGKWTERRVQETDGNRLITYCAGCVNLLSKTTPTSHALDLIFEPETSINAKSRTVNAPINYLNRLKLKHHFRKNMKNSVSRERTFQPEGTVHKGRMTKRILLLLAVIAAIIAIRFTGITEYLDQESLGQLLQNYGILAPIIYMMIYLIAPALFIPGLPLTVAGGILFGPFWGVLYAIISATGGACVAFLISRYIAREWIESKLKNSKWQKLDDGVERHGWKVVAFTRLIPLFPFNLLNYAFGLTRIKFLPYALTSFICMLPGCIAYVVFSSSLLEVLQGRISKTFVIGLILVVLVSLIPIIYRYYKHRKGFSDPL